ncbi:MAG: hypothetical protein HC942_31095 [Microcoleus sp. SU_5_6]|nr:hypothetical protein [Microcoleus sp. SU_5_6]
MIVDSHRVNVNRLGNIDPHVEPQGFQSNENGQIVVDVHQVVRELDGKLLVDRMVQHIYTIEDGSIGQMDIQEL